MSSGSATAKNASTHAITSEDDDMHLRSRMARSSSEPASMDEAGQLMLCQTREWLELDSERRDRSDFTRPAKVQFSAERLSQKVEFSVESGDKHASNDSCETSGGSKQTSSSSSAGRTQTSSSSDEEVGKKAFRKGAHTEASDHASGYTADCSGSASQPSGSVHDSGSGQDSGSQDSEADSTEKADDRAPCVDTSPWDERHTTVTIRQLDRSFTQWMLITEVNNRGFEGLFDFVYVPFDSAKGCNVGYAFMNFLEPKLAKAFRDAFNGSVKSLLVQYGKTLLVHPAAVQGYEANFRHVMLGKASQYPDHQVCPLFLRRQNQCESRQQQGKACPESQIARGHWATIHFLETTASQSDQDTLSQSCHSCGTPFAGKHNFCANCGTCLKDVCHSCGTPHSTNDKFCVKCGVCLADRGEPKQRVQKERC